MSALNISNYRLTIAAGQEQAIVALGTRLRCLSATGPFRVGLESEATFPFEGGMAVALPDGAQFQNVRLINPGASAITVEVVISFGDFIDDRSTFAGTMNVAVLSAPAVTIAAGQSVAISGTPAVSISGTPAVTLSGTNTVEVGSLRGLGFNDGSDASVTTTPALLWSSQAGTGRRLLIVQNIGWNDARIGSTNLISSSRGLLLRPGETAMIESWFQIYGMAVSGTTTLTRSMSIY